MRSFSETRFRFGQYHFWVNYYEKQLPKAGNMLDLLFLFVANYSASYLYIIGTVKTYADRSGSGCNRENKAKAVTGCKVYVIPGLVSR